MPLNHCVLCANSFAYAGMCAVLISLCVQDVCAKVHMMVCVCEAACMQAFVNIFLCVSAHHILSLGRDSSSLPQQTNNVAARVAVGPNRQILYGIA